MESRVGMLNDKLCDFHIKFKEKSLTACPFICLAFGPSVHVTSSPGLYAGMNFMPTHLVAVAMAMVIDGQGI